jgi:hypothetical protein
MFPDEGLEKLLGLVESLSKKIADIDSAGFLDASVLGEAVHPRNFNTLRRINAEDETVFDEEDQFSELASSESMLQQLRGVLGAVGKESIEALPNGIHSGLARPGSRGAFFYFKVEPRPGGVQHFWRYVDLKTDSILDNRFLLASLIACNEQTPRVIDPAMWPSVFDLQERVIADILETVQRQRALEAVPRTVDPAQQSLVVLLQAHLNDPDVDRALAIEIIRFLGQPMLPGQLRALREIARESRENADIRTLIDALGEMRRSLGGVVAQNEARVVGTTELRRQDLQLVCFDFISG